MKFFHAKKKETQKQNAPAPLYPAVIEKKTPHHVMKVEETIIRVGRGPFKKSFRMKTVTEIVEN